LRSLEDENRRLKHLVADLSLDKEALKAIVRKNGWAIARPPSLPKRRDPQFYMDEKIDAGHEHLSGAENSQTSTDAPGDKFPNCRLRSHIWSREDKRRHLKVNSLSIPIPELSYRDVDA